MPEKDDLTSMEQGALIRYGAISYILQLQEQGHALAEALRQASARPWPDARCGKHYAIRTLEDWWYAYQGNGFQALANRPRQDLGKRRSLTPEQQEWLISQRQQYPRIPLKVAYRRWIKEGKDLPSLTTLYRFVREAGLHRQSTDGNDCEGPTKAFEAPFPNDLWMTDFSPGPKLITAEGKEVGTHLGLIIDDHSRLIPYAAYYTHENTQSLHHALKEAIRRRGLPHKLYADNGAAFISKHTHIVCANLGIRLIHHKPYRAWSKGKVERVFSSIQLGFETTLCLPEERVHTIAELNAKLSTWIQNDYHSRQHSSTGTTPQARFQDGSEHLRQLELSHHSLEKLFHTRLERTVRKNGTIRIANKVYEVNLSLRGRKIEVRYDPFNNQTEPEVYHQGHYIGTAHLADLHANSQLHHGHHNYERR